MIQEIKYGGMTSVKSDYECNDGELAYAQNCIHEGEGIESTTSFDSVDYGEYKPVFIHDNRVILWRENKVYYKVDDNEPTELNIGRSVSTDSAIYNSIGNTLMINPGSVDVGAFQSAVYCLWQGTQYKVLGEKPPMVELFFGLKSHAPGNEYTLTEQGSNTEIWTTFGPITWIEHIFNEVGKKYEVKTDDGMKALTEACFAQVNKLLEDVESKNLFALPFFLRYALRLYDGSLTMHSAPILMLPYSEGVLVTINRYVDGGEYKSNKCIASCNACKLNFRVFKNYESVLNDWKDIVKSIDIFVSKPIYPFDINKDVIWASESISLNGVSTCSEYGTDKYKNHVNILEKHPEGTMVLELPKKDKFHDDILNASTFYLIGSYSIDNLPEPNVTWLVDDNNLGLDILTSKEVMTDDYDSHFPKCYKTSYTYNSRFIIGDIGKEKFFNQSLASRLPYNSEIGDYWVVAKFKDGRKLIKKDKASPEMMYYIFFPFEDIETLEIYDTSTSLTDYRYSFKPSDFLNGSVHYNKLRTIYEDYFYANPPDTEILSIYSEEPNKLYVSDVNNPLVFQPQNISTIGEEPITALAVSTQAISDGQFGQYPFFVFSKDGIWALEISTEGVPMRPKPISRLVAKSSGALLSIDSENLFAADNGVYSISGGTTTLISKDLDKNEYFSDIPTHVMSVSNEKGYPLNQLGSSFAEYAKESVMAYDYVNKRIYVCNPNKKYSYVFSMKTGWWYTTKEILFTNTLNYYPECKVVCTNVFQDEEGTHTKYSIVNLEDFSERVASTIITRPLKLGAPDTFKTIERIIQRGNFEPSHVKQILYGSNDLKTWRLLASSVDKYLNGLRGHAYKYFRLALFMNLEEGESLTGCTIQFTPRGTNVLR